MGDDEPLHKLANAILLGGLRGGQEIRVERTERRRSVVSFLIGGEEREEMRPPVKLHAALVGRFCEIAGISAEYPPGGAAEGWFTMTIGEHRRVHYALRPASLASREAFERGELGPPTLVVVETVGEVMTGPPEVLVLKSPKL